MPRRARRWSSVATVLAAILLIIAPAALGARNFVIVVSGEHAVLDALTEGATATLSGAFVVTLGDNVRLDDLRDRMRHADGVLAIGKVAFEAVTKASGPSLPVAYCAYGSEGAEGLRSDTSRFVIQATTPLIAYNDLVKQVLPTRTNVAVLYKSDDGVTTETAGPGLTTRHFHIPAWGQLKQVTTEALTWGDVLWLPPDPEFTSTALAFIIKLSLQMRRPLLSSSPRIIRGGSIGGLVRDPRDVGRAAATWLRDGGAADRSLPTPELVVNKDVAAYLDIPFPVVFNGRPRQYVGK